MGRRRYWKVNAIMAVLAVVLLVVLAIAGWRFLNADTVRSEANRERVPVSQPHPDGTVDGRVLSVDMDGRIAMELADGKVITLEWQEIPSQVLIGYSPITPTNTSLLVRETEDGGYEVLPADRPIDSLGGQEVDGKTTGTIIAVDSDGTLLVQPISTTDLVRITKYPADVAAGYYPLTVTSVVKLEKQADGSYDLLSSDATIE